MINWRNPDDCEGVFTSKFFRNDEQGDEFFVYVADMKMADLAEKSVEAFNNLPESVIDEICEKLADCVEEGGIDEDFELPELENVREILNYCWFISMYVDMQSEDDEIAYVIEGEGDWGEAIGFVIRNNKLIYVGSDYSDYIKYA